MVVVESFESTCEKSRVSLSLSRRLVTIYPQRADEAGNKTALCGRV
jgi:hypothetical protein